MANVPTPTSRNGRKSHLSIWDLFCAVVSPILALYLSRSQVLMDSHYVAVANYWLLAAGFSLLAFFAFRLRDSLNRNFSVQDAIDIIEAVLFAELMTGAILFTFTRMQGFPRSMPLFHGALLAAGLIVGRIAARIVFTRDREVSNFQTRAGRIILIGANRFAATFIKMLETYVPRQQPVVALLDEDPKIVGQTVGGVQVLGTPHELDAIISEFAIHGISPQRVIIAGESDSLMPETLRAIEKICVERQIDIEFLPRMVGLTETKHAKVPVKVAGVQESPVFMRPSFARLKRGIDIVGSLGLLILFSPLLLIAGFLVLWDVGRPVLFWQERLGWKERSFLMYKFRTLGAPFDSDGNLVFMGRQPSFVGRLLRATRIDELPQLLNVLFGDMSLIGPRPLLPEDQPADRTIRLSIRPGISGWAQVNGGKLVSKERKQKLDEWYVRNASLGLDFRIALMTVKMMVSGYSASEENSTDELLLQNRDVNLEQTIGVRSGVGDNRR